MTTDNRTNEPTEAMVEAAAQAALRVLMEQLPEDAQEGWSEEEMSEALELQREVQRAALVAAQGAAPQAESNPTSSYISPHLPAQIRGLYRADLREKSIQTMLDLAGDLIQELIDLRSAPVLPSSGIDEDKLAEVIDAALGKWEGLEPSVVFVARAVTAWLKDEARA